jgi:hypothetical protein
MAVPFQGPAGSRRRVGVLWWIILCSMAGSMGIDLWMTVSLRTAEREAFARALQTVGSIEGLSKYPFPERVAYHLHCRFQDANKEGHSIVFQLRDPDELVKLAPAAGQAIRAELLPVNVQIAYDPDRPERCWLADLGWKDDTRIYCFSLGVFFCQVLVDLLFVLKLREVIKSQGVFPWWYDLHSVLPLAVEAMLLLIFGGLQLFFPGRPVFWGDLWFD